MKASSTSFLALSCVGSLISAPALATETGAIVVEMAENLTAAERMLVREKIKDLRKPPRRGKDGKDGPGRGDRPDGPPMPPPEAGPDGAPLPPPPEAEPEGGP